MKNTLIVVGVLALILVLAGSSMIGTYNSLVRLQQDVSAQWAVVESTLQRRHDLIPNLVESVKGAMAHEQEVFTNIADARARMAGAATVDEKAAAASQLEGALSRLLIVMENYPQLKATDQVARLMNELAGTENRINVERNRFNEQVRSYNTKLLSFPTVIIGRMMGFNEANYFEAAPGAQNAPQVRF